MEKDLEGLTRREVLRTGFFGLGACLGSQLFGSTTLAEDLVEERDSLDLRVDFVKEYKLPSPRKNHGIVIVNDRMYVIGGLDEKDKPVPNVLVAKIQDKLNFDETSSLMENLSCTCAVTNGSHVYTFSPRTAGRISLAKIKEDGNLDQWNSFHGLLTDATSTFVTDGKILYAIGGQDSNSGSKGYHDEVWVSEIGQDGWPKEWNSKTPRIQGRRSGHGAVVENGRLYIVGGWQYHSPFELNDVQVAEIKEDGLKEFAKLRNAGPKTRLSSVTAQRINNQNYLFSFGGATGTDGKPTSELRYALLKPNGATENWNSLSTEISPVYELASAWNGNDLYVVGGWDGRTTSDKVTRLRVVPKKSKLF